MHAFCFTFFWSIALQLQAIFLRHVGDVDIISGKEISGLANPVGPSALLCDWCVLFSQKWLHLEASFKGYCVVWWTPLLFRIVPLSNTEHQKVRGKWIREARVLCTSILAHQRQVFALHISTCRSRWGSLKWKQKYIELMMTPEKETSPMLSFQTYKYIGYLYLCIALLICISFMWV